MELKVVFLAFLAFVAFCIAEQNCGDVQCQLLPVGEDAVGSEFHLKASEKGVRMVYLNLNIGNDSYHPLEAKDEFLPKRWVWARSISEPMLSLQYDYDILSLGLLNYQVRSMSIQLKEKPSGCLAGLNASCKHIVVGRVLLVNVTQDSSSEHSRKSEVVCVAMIEKLEKPSTNSKATFFNIKGVKYRCCSRRPNAILFRCDLPVHGSEWFNAFKYVLLIPIFVLIFYWPVLLIQALPDYVFSLRYECNKEDRTEDQTRNSAQPESIVNNNRIGHEQNQNKTEAENRLTIEQIPVEDVGPITCTTLLRAYVQRLPDLRLTFNIKLAVLEYCIFPFVFYIQLGLYLTVKQEYLRESSMKLPPGTHLSEFSPNIRAAHSDWFYIVGILWAFTSLASILFLRPKDLMMGTCPLCDLTDCFVTDFGCNYNLSRGNIPFVSDAMLHHFKILQPLIYLSMTFNLNLHNRWLKKLINLVSRPLQIGLNDKVSQTSRTRRAICVLWVLISILPTLFCGLVFGAVCLAFVLFTSAFVLVFFSPIMSLYFFVVAKFKIATVRLIRPLKYLVMLFCILYILALVASSFFPVTAICAFVIGMFGFTIMGLVLNAEIVTPYVAFLLVVTTNIYLCYVNLQNTYKEVKEIILKYWQKESQMADSDLDTIPTKLFWFVCDRVFPVETEICLMLRNMALIVTFLYLALSSIILFGNTYNISVVVSTIAVFVSGAIPGLFFKGLTKGKNFSGWRKIEAKREIEMAVKEFYQKRSSAGMNNESEEGSESQNSHVV